MVIKFFQTLARYSKTLLITVLLITGVFVWQAKINLFDEKNSLIIDSTVEPFMARESGTYDFFKEMRNIFGSEEVLVISAQPEKGKFDLDFFLKISTLSKDLESRLPGVKSVSDLTTTPRIDGACSGDSFFHKESIGSVCKSILDEYKQKLECVNNKEKYLAQLPKEENQEDDDSLGDMLDDEEVKENDADETEYGEEETNTSKQKEEMVCTANILNSREGEITRLTETEVASVFEEIKKHDLIHKDLISTDFKTAALVVEFKLSAIPSNPKIQETLAAILEEHRAKGLIIAFSGQSRDEYTASKTLTSDIVKILPWSIVLMMITLYLSFKTIRGMLIPLTIVIIGMIWTFGLFAITGFTMNMVTMVLPPLLICVGSAYIIHFINQYYLDIAANPGASPYTVTQETIRHITVPLTVTALTTLAGFAALTVSPIPAVKEMGIFACVGIASIIFFTLSVVPALLSFMKIPKLKTFEGKKTIVDKILIYKSELVGKYSKRFIVFWIILGILAFGGLLQVRVDSETKNFPADSPIETDKAFIQNNLAGTSTLRLVFSGKDSDQDLQTAETIYGIMKLRDWLTQSSGENELKNLNQTLKIDKVYSAVEYVDIHRNGLDNLKDPEVVSFFKDAKKRNFPKYLSDDKKLMQVNIRMNMKGTTALLELKNILDRKLPEFLPKLEVKYTGSGILSSESADNISRGQVNSVILALSIIFVIMSIMFFSFKMGLIALYPNIIAISVYFGTLGWIDIPIGVTISVIASIALGIGVDDTIHFLNHHNGYVNKFRDEKKASLATMLDMGKPMVYTTMSLSLGFVIFYIAEMESQVMFGVLTAYTLIVCLITDTNFLPSIMVNTKLVTAWNYLGLDIKKQLAKEVPLFEGMRLPQIKLAALMAFTSDLKKGELLFKEGETGNELFVILKGSIDIYLDEEFRDERIQLACLSEGQSFGEMGLFRRSKRTASARAATDCQLMVLNEAVLIRLQKRYPRVATKLFMNLAKSLGRLILQTDLKITEKVEKQIKAGIPPKKREEPDIRQVVDHIIEDGLITFDERKELNHLIYADHHVSPEEQEQLDRLNRLIEEGAIIEEEAVFVSIFQKLKPGQMKWIYKEFEVKKIPKGVRIFSQGDYGDYMLVVMNGKFTVEKEIGSKVSPVATVFEGDVIGSINAICGEDLRTSSVYTLEESEVIFISMERLRRMRKERLRLAAQLYYNIVCMLSDRLESANKKLYS